MDSLFKIAIVEDEADAALVLQNHFKRLSAETGDRFVIVSYSSGQEFIDKYDYKSDIIMLDIELPGINGMEVAKKIRQRDNDVVIIFVTNLAQYAVEGYSVGALDFIVKPVTYFNFSMKIKRAITRANNRKDVSILLTLKGGQKKCVNTSSIKYIEVMNHTLCFHTLDGDFVINGSISSITDKLKGLPFALCNRCYLVNLAFVEGTNQYDVKVGGTTLQISHLKRKEFLQKLNYFFSGRTLE